MDSQQYNFYAKGGDGDIVPAGSSNPIVAGLQRMIEQQREKKRQRNPRAEPRTRYKEGSYADQSGRERNLAAMYERQYRAMQNNPHLQPGYWDNGSIRPAQLTPAKLTPVVHTPVWR